jgi:hypothetical protein
LATDDGAIVDVALCDDGLRTAMSRRELTAYVVVVALTVVAFCAAYPLAVALPAAGVPELLAAAVTLGRQRRLRRGR